MAPSEQVHLNKNHDSPDLPVNDLDRFVPRVYCLVSPDAAPRLQLNLSSQRLSGSLSMQENNTEESTPPDLANQTGVQDGNGFNRVNSTDIEFEESTRASPHLNCAKTACLQVLASFLINMNVYGLVNAFGVFQNFYETNYSSADTSSAISWIGTVQGALVLLVGAMAGPVFDKGYFSITLKVVSIVLVFSWMMLSLSTQYYQLMLTQGFLAGICAGLLEVPSIAMISVHFLNRRGLALGLALSGAPMGGLIYSSIFRAVLDSTDFAWATRAVGLVVLITLGLAIVVIQPLDTDRQSPIRTFLDMSAFRHFPFVCLCISAFFTYCAALVPFFIVPTYALALGSDPHTATYLSVVMNSAQILGRIVPAALSDYIGGAYMLFVAMILVGVMGFAWVGVTSIPSLIAFSVFYGLVSGTVATLPATVIPHICPSPSTLGTRIGMIYASAGVGTLIGNPVALATTGHALRKHQFLGSQLWMGLCALVGAGFFVVPAITANKVRASRLLPASRVIVGRNIKPGP